MHQLLIDDCVFGLVTYLNSGGKIGDTIRAVRLEQDLPPLSY